MDERGLYEWNVPGMQCKTVNGSVPSEQSRQRYGYVQQSYYPAIG